MKRTSHALQLPCSVAMTGTTLAVLTDGRTRLVLALLLGVVAVGAASCDVDHCISCTAELGDGEDGEGNGESGSAECEQCGTGYWLAGPYECTACAACVDGVTYDAGGGCNGIDDTNCQSCTSCDGEDQFYAEACSGTNAGTCGTCATTCPADQTSDRNCGGGSEEDTTCSDCFECEPGVTTESVPCTFESDRECEDCFSCDVGEYVAAPCTVTAQTQCSDCGDLFDGCSECTSEECTACEATRYLAGDGGDGEDGEEAACVLRTVCGEGFYTTPGGATSDDSCSPCHESCASDCSGPSSGDCSCSGEDCELCAVGYFPSGTGATIDCEACPVTCSAADGCRSGDDADAGAECVACATGFYLGGDDSDAVGGCSAVTQCGDGFHEVQAPTPTSDRVCAEDGPGSDDSGSAGASGSEPEADVLVQIDMIVNGMSASECASLEDELENEADANLCNENDEDCSWDLTDCRNARRRRALAAGDSVVVSWEVVVGSRAFADALATEIQDEAVQTAFANAIMQLCVTCGDITFGDVTSTVVTEDEASPASRGKFSLLVLSAGVVVANVHIY